MEKWLKYARNIQGSLSKRVIIKDIFQRPISHIAGIDLAFSNESASIACVIISIPSLEIIYTKSSTVKIDVPYISTFLFFREGPPILDMMNSLQKIEPSVFLINAQGIAHPLLCGCASHVGVLSQKPTIGVATNNLCGEYTSKPKNVTDYVSMSYLGKQVGWVFKSKRKCNPIFVSPGHLVGMESSIQIVVKCMGAYKLPLPLYYAHISANNARASALN